MGLSQSAYKIGKRRRWARKKEVQTPNVPKLLFPASFTRVGAQTVDPTLFPAPCAICGEALITSKVKRWRVAQNLLIAVFPICNEIKIVNIKVSYLTFSYFLSSSMVGVRLASLRIKPAWLRCDPSRRFPLRGTTTPPRRTAHDKDRHGVSYL